jgi:arylsulfatase A-like enzyme
MKNLMNRRSFLASIGAAGAASGAASRQNVLFIPVDDLNDWIGCLGGHPDTRTPNFDRLARRGTLFTNAHCAAPLCNPSRAALMTGIRPSTSGVYQNPQPWRQAAALQNAVTLPQHFMANGYFVAGGGKTYHDSYPDPASWQEYFPSKTQQKPEDPMPPGRPLNGIPNTAHFDWGPVDVPDSKMGDSQVVDWAIGQLRKPHRQPFFLACGLFRPHLPWYVPPKYFDLFPLNSITLPNVKPDDLDDIPPLGRKMARPEGDHKKVIDHGQWRKAVQGYLASIAFTDAMLGRLLDAFEDSPHARNTTVVLWSDHGWHLGEKLHWRKFALWEEATHNVLMISSPGLTRPGTRCRRTVSLMDVYPTLIDICGLPARAGLEGVSLAPLLKDPGAKWDRPAVTTYGRNNHSVRSEKWRYIRYSDGTEELYDRENDEMEWTNLASKPELAPVKKDLTRWLPAVNAPDAPYDKEKRGGE